MYFPWHRGEFLVFWTDVKLCELQKLPLSSCETIFFFLFEVFQVFTRLISCGHKSNVWRYRSTLIDAKWVSADLVSTALGTILFSPLIRYLKIYMLAYLFLDDSPGWLTFVRLIKLLLSYEFQWQVEPIFVLHGSLLPTTLWKCMIWTEFFLWHKVTHLKLNIGLHYHGDIMT